MDKNIIKAIMLTSPFCYNIFCNNSKKNVNVVILQRILLESRLMKKVQTQKAIMKMIKKKIQKKIIKKNHNINLKKKNIIKEQKS